MVIGGKGDSGVLAELAGESVLEYTLMVLGWYSVAVDMYQREPSFQRSLELIHECPICGGPGRILARSSLDHRGMPLPYEAQYLLCKPCELLYQSPLPLADTIARDVNAGSWEQLQRKEDAARGFRQRNMRLYVEAIGPSIEWEGQSVLEVGAGAGHFLALLREHGAAELLGLELDHQAIRYGTERYGLTMESRPIEALPANRFGVVVGHQLIEHVLEPTRFLKQLHRVLAPGGSLVLSTPDCMSYGRRILGPRWAHLTFNQHLYIFSPRSLSHLLVHAGFEIVAVREHVMFDRSVPKAAVKFFAKKALGRFGLKDNHFGTDGFLVVARKMS